MTLEMKQYILEEITARGVLTETKAVLMKLNTELLCLLTETESQAGGIENWALRLLIMKLDIGEEKKMGHTRVILTGRSISNGRGKEVRRMGGLLIRLAF